MENSKSTISNTGYKGIHFRKSKGKFEVDLCLYKGSQKTKSHFSLGLCDTLKEAVKAREDFIKSLF